MTAYIAMQGGGGQGGCVQLETGGGQNSGGATISHGTKVFKPAIPLDTVNSECTGSCGHEECNRVAVADDWQARGDKGVGAVVLRGCTCTRHVHTCHHVVRYR